MDLGVLAGAKIMFHVEPLTPCTPYSAIVGTLGNTGDLRSLAKAIAFNFPDLISARAELAVSKVYK